MSIPFTSLGPEDADKAGYFRIGHIVLKTPPTDILTNRVSGKERMTVLRGSNDLVKLTGKGRWDVTVRWIALQDDTAPDLVGRYAQWEDLRSIVAIFKVAPFVEVENYYIRQVLCEQDPTVSNSMRMGFALRQLRISTHADIVDALDCSLTMTWFNYFPYSSDFAYQAASGVGGDAVYSDAFISYIEAWKASNLNSNSNPFYDGPLTIDYKRQKPGDLKLNWREYRTFKINTAVVTNVTPAQAAANSALQGQASQAPIATYGSSLQIALAAIPVAQSIGQKINVPPQIIFAEFCHETGNFTNRGATQLNNLAGINIPGGHGQDYRTFASLPAFGDYYANLITSRYKGCIGVTTITDYATGLKAGGWFTDSLSNYINGMTRFQNAYSTYQAKIGTVPTTKPAQAIQAQAAQPALAAKAAATPKAGLTKPSSQSTSLSGQTDADQLLASLSPADQTSVQQLLANGWVLDFGTNDLAYVYITHELDLSPDNTSPSPVMPVRQVSILMVNNLAQIPLASYMYPTYQHIGSPSSEISIGFVSVGDWSVDGEEPRHVGISLLGGLISFLEAQYLAYRNNTRDVQSLHRFHAVLADNQILNMLGIRGLTLDNLSTETIPDASDLVQVELSGKQYENIFESTDSFKIRTIDTAAQNVTQSLVKSNAISSMDPTEQKVIPNLTTFSAGRKSASVPVLCTYLLQLGVQTTDVFSGFDVAGSTLPTISPTAAQISAMLAPVTSTVQATTQPVVMNLSSSMTGGYVPALQTQASTSAYYASQYPAIAKHLVSISGKWSIGDAFLVEALSTDTSQSSTTGLQAAAAIVLAGQTASSFLNGNTSGIQAAYDAVFPLLSGTNSAFAQEVNTLADSPTFSAKYQAAFDAAGPALSQSNTTGTYSDHTCYRDMGLRTLSIGADNNPGSYFLDHSAAYDGMIRSTIETVVNGAANTSAQLNASTTDKEYYMAIKNIDFIKGNADVNSLVKMTNVPGLSMAEAFPTFKLFLMEDEAGGVINCYDNFYSYASVTDIEVVRYQDKPDVAVIQITNVANLLMHHLYDATLMGRYTAGLRKWEGQTPAGGQVTGGSQTTQIIAGRTPYGAIYRDLSDGMLVSKRERIPLQYVALQAGTKIQVRLGYSNNPDKLTPVFTGRVTQINTEDDMLIITAESFLGELCTIPTYSSGQPQKARDFGAEYTSSDAGDTNSVVEYLLGADQAKHFGGFQLNALPDQLITGLTWQNRLGKAIGDYSVGSNNIITEVGAALASSYDRRGENILINHVINYRGTPSSTRDTPIIATRPFQDSSSSSMFLKFTYHVKKDSTFTTWDLIKDVCRRYPEYIVACKQYAFPYSADATMLVAHPLDWYFARPPMIGDVERYHTGLTQDAQWTQWWNAQGRALWDVMVTRVKGEMGYLSESQVRAKLGGTGNAASSLGFSTSSNYPTGPADMDDKMQGFLNSIKTLTGLDAGSKNPGALSSLLYGADILAETSLNYLLSVPNILLGGGSIGAELNSKFKAVQGEMVAIRDSWMLWLQIQNPQPFDRLKPVRRYHFIDHNTIIHNGMVVNDKIYNAVKVREDTIKANGHVPANYVRVLDVTSLLNDPEHNLDTKAIRAAVGQSFLKEEVGKMYDGEIVLRGVPEIEPYDCLVLLDASTAITGIVEVGKVIHSFSQENGYITVVTPRCLVAINESASANLARMFMMIMSKTAFTIGSLGPNGGLGQAWHSADSIQKGIGIGGVAAAVTGTAALTALIGVPMLWPVAILAGVCMFGGFLVTGYENETANNIQVLPVSRWGRPWVGGLEGYEIADFFQNLGSDFKAWEADNIYPLIDTYRYVRGAQINTLPIQPATPAVPAGSTPSLNPPVKP